MRAARCATRWGSQPSLLPSVRRWRIVAHALHRDADFHREIVKLLSDEEYRRLQLALFLRPEFGRIIRQSGGLRKVRWSLTGKGKSGGIRVIYYWDPPGETFYMLLPYAKNKQEDLTAQQLKALGRLVREEFR